jgi:hypothetical protein
MNMTMQAVGIDSCVFQRGHEGPLFETIVGARAEFMEFTCLGIPYLIPSDVEGKPIVRKATLENIVDGIL